MSTRPHQRLIERRRRSALDFEFWWGQPSTKKNAIISIDIGKNSVYIVGLAGLILDCMAGFVQIRTRAGDVDLCAGRRRLEGAQGCAGEGPITIKGWLGYAERRVAQLYEEIRAGKLRAWLRSQGCGENADAQGESTTNPAFIGQATQHAQTSAFFDIFKQKQDAVIRPASADNR
ncbi:MAG: hypothetical protein ACLPSW_23575 [Roseiarcus sp.]